MRRKNLLNLIALAVLISSPITAPAETVTAAVAANFTAVVQRLTPDFERRTGHKLLASFGATGKLYAQIQNGAPFDVLLSADDETPRRLEDEGQALRGSRFTYAIGRLVLWSRDPMLVDGQGQVLKNGTSTHLAIANPKTAPYGAAAEQVLRKLGVWQRWSPRLVQGENISQTFQFISTGNAPLGFVALAQVRGLPAAQAGSQWLVPEKFHDPLRQDAVLLTASAHKEAARALLDYLRSAPAQAVIEEFGYAVTRHAD